MKFLFFILFSLSGILFGFAQETVVKDVDSLYKEDQFYAGVTYNLLVNKPKDVSQNGFSLGFHLGIIKDIPLNKKRNVAIGIGLGYSANSFIQNILINKNNVGDFEYTVLDDSNSFSKNKYSNHLLEVPIEFRWRTSTPTNYNFWRIYTGFKFGCVFSNTTQYQGDLGNLSYTDNKDFNKFQYGLTLSAGYNTWNIYMYYALNPVFSKDTQLNGGNLEINEVKVGLMFYIL
ncbi:porin family protein [uncultured Algibacter sp.]|uniref:porin family protein n=1 Tax=uncultured Algibacter sp. TaxID=298659 RepID=UPI002629F528|nr:porin family protein [uncultured Algibacter sp.]